MNILWLAWKDYTHPEHGGAEIVLRELMKRQVQEGHHVTLLTARHKGSAARETLDGITIIRIGNNRYIHPLQALWYYLRHLRNKYDLVIETVNTAPYFSLLFRGKGKRFAFYHQLAREIWYFETKKPLSHVGYYLIEPIATWLLGRARAPLITVSDSTRQDLARFGWRPEHTHLISEGIEISPVPNLNTIKKFARPTLLSLGAMRGMKRTIDQVKAFELAKQDIPELQLKIAGDSSGAYGKTVLEYIQNSPFRDDIEYLGRVSYEQKIELMRRADLITVTSVKEGWGLIVTEAASQGTPAIVYDVDGLRDSVKDGQTGVITKQTPAALAAGIITTLQNKTRYDSMQRQAWEWSKHITFDQSYQDFKHITEGAIV
ncbi:MAG TPA: glycosyltransferase family 4 protein [Patescibacteria group bacterium]|nr:glycosyltransferase family 4 protein [Patescibacteria group bacterium]